MTTSKSKYHKRTDISILAAPFGFGPLGKALAIAHEFRKRGLSVKILGDDLARSIIESNRIIAETYEYRKPLNLRELDTKLVISCLDISTPITKHGVPLVLVDSLYWLRGSWERPLVTNADLILVQRFFMNSPYKLLTAQGNIIQAVDAILPTSSVNPIFNNYRKSIVFYPGGLRSPYLDFNYQEKYYSWSVDIILEAIEKSMSDVRDLIAIVPPQMLETTSVQRIRLLGGQIESSANDLGAFLAKARCLIVAPGIEIMLEACATGNIPYYLPAYNGSHIPQLLSYRIAGIGAEICPSHRNTIRDLEIQTNNLSQLSIEVERRNIDILMDIRFKDEAILNLSRYLRLDNRCSERYPLGRNGAEQVVNNSLKLLDKKVNLLTYEQEESNLSSSILTGSMK